MVEIHHSGRKPSNLYYASVSQRRIRSDRCRCCQTEIEVAELDNDVLKVCCCWMAAQRPSNMPVYLNDGSALTIVHADKLRWKQQIKLALQPGYTILIPGQPVSVLIL